MKKGKKYYSNEVLYKLYCRYYNLFALCIGIIIAVAGVVMVAIALAHDLPV